MKSLERTIQAHKQPQFRPAKTTCAERYQLYVIYFGCSPLHHEIASALSVDAADGSDAPGQIKIQG